MRGPDGPGWSRPVEPVVRPPATMRSAPVPLRRLAPAGPLGVRAGRRLASEASAGSAAGGARRREGAGQRASQARRGRSSRFRAWDRLVAGRHGHRTHRGAVEQPLATRRARLGEPGDVEADLGPGVGGVDVLAAGAARRGEAPRQLADEGMATAGAGSPRAAASARRVGSPSAPIVCQPDHPLSGATGCAPIGDARSRARPGGSGSRHPLPCPDAPLPTHHPRRNTAACQTKLPR